MNEQDLRVQRTRRLLQEAFIELANSQDYHEITIREVTKKAQVGYKTFFRHYKSIEELVEAIIDKLINKFEQETAMQPKAIEQNTLLALEITKNNSKLFLSILKSPLSHRLIQAITAVGYRDSQQFTLNSDLPSPLVQHHFSVSVVSLVKWWLENGMIYSPEEMGQYIRRLVLSPLQLVE